MKTLILMLAFVLAFSLCAVAQTGVVAFDSSNNSYYVGGSPLTWSMNNGGSAVVACFFGDTVGGHDDITSVTYASQAMSLVGEYSASKGSRNNNNYVYVYVLNGAPTGLHSFAVNFTNAHFASGSSVSYRNAMVVPMSGVVTGPNAGSPYTTSLTTTVPNSWVGMCGGGGTDAASTGDTFRATGSPFSTATLFDSNALVATPGSYSMTTTSDLTKDDVHIMYEIIPIAQQPSYISFDNATDLGNVGGGTLTHAYTNSGSLLRVCVVGDYIKNGNDDVLASDIAYNGTTMTLIDHYSSPDGSKTNNRYTYLFELANPSTGAHNITITSTTSHFIAAVAASYYNAQGLGTSRHQHNGPYTSSPVSFASYATIAGAWMQTCGGGASEANNPGSFMYRRIQGATYSGPSIFDSNNLINPARTFGVNYTFNTVTTDDISVTAEILPKAPFNLNFYSQVFSSSSSWDFTAANSGLTSCSNISVVAWDTTVNPYAILTPSGVVCDASFNVTASFSGTQTGIMSIVASQNQ